jgi:hypothetical protein
MIRTIHVDTDQLTNHIREYSSLDLVSTDIPSISSTTTNQAKLNVLISSNKDEPRHAWYKEKYGKIIYTEIAAMDRAVI